jgi:thiamine biosynthesis lipoprotein
VLLACSASPETRKIEGATMGTWYHITWVETPGAPGPATIQSSIDQELAAINASMSTYLDDSEINRFNDLPPGQWFEPGAAMLEVFKQARQVSIASDGAYDVTVAPLVDLWGFGPQRHSNPPQQEQIEQALLTVGQQYVELDSRGRLRKQRPLQLDFSSIAKGYAVDRLSMLLSDQGIERHMVEIGGEIRVQGLSPRGSPWRIAVEQPDPRAAAPAAVLEFTDVAVATSGDYRNFFEVDGISYSHTIDPRTGRPVLHELVSVTVIQPSAALADAWATALAAIGPAAALALAESEQLPVFLISRQGEGFSSEKTAAMTAYLR